MNGMGFNLLSQEEKKKKGKTFMDYAPGHVGDDNYVTTWINVNKVDSKKRKNYTDINNASFWLGERPLL